MRVFVDTNIFLDLILRREHFDKALLIFNAIEKRLFSGVILDITILNIDYVANKQIKDVKEFLKLLTQYFEIVGASNKIIEDALKLENSDLEDNVQYLSAKNAKCEMIITNDQNFYKGNIPVVSSSAFVDRYLQ
jgi:predicted nucleic acid-binding protein